MVRRLKRRLMDTLKVLVGALLLAILAVACLQVALRYVFGASLLWAEEVSVMALAWLAWLGMAHLWLSGQHIVVDIAVAGRASLGRAVALASDIAAVAGGIGFTIVAGKTLDAFSGIELGSLEIDAGIKYYPLVAGGLGLALAGVVNLLEAFETRRQ